MWVSHNQATIYQFLTLRGLKLLFFIHKLGKPHWKPHHQIGRVAEACAP